MVESRSYAYSTHDSWLIGAFLCAPLREMGRRFAYRIAALPLRGDVPRDGSPVACTLLRNRRVNTRARACVCASSSSQRTTARPASGILMPCICATVRIEFQLYAWFTCHSPATPRELHPRYLAPLHPRLDRARNGAPRSPFLPFAYKISDKMIARVLSPWGGNRKLDRCVTRDWYFYPLSLRVWSWLTSKILVSSIFER